MMIKCPFEKYRGKAIRITAPGGGTRVMLVPMDCIECEQYDSAGDRCRLTKGADKA